MYSSILFEQKAGIAVITNGYDVSIDSMAMSFSGSKGMFFSIAGYTG